MVDSTQVVRGDVEQIQGSGKNNGPTEHVEQLLTSVAENADATYVIASLKTELAASKKQSGEKISQLEGQIKQLQAELERYMYPEDKESPSVFLSSMARTLSDVTGIDERLSRATSFQKPKDELGALQHQFNELQEQTNQLNEQLRKSEAEKQQLQSELGRRLFLEDKGRRSELMLSREIVTGQSRPCAGSASSALTGMAGRLLDVAGPRQEPMDELGSPQHQFNELQEQTNPLKEQLKNGEAEKQQLQSELGRYLFLEDKGRRSELMLSREIVTGQSRPCAGSASSALMNMDERLLGVTGPPQEPRSEHLSVPPESLPCTDVLPRRRLKESLTTNRNSYVSTGSAADDGVSRPEQRDCEYNLYASVSSAESSGMTDQEMSVGSVNTNNERLPLQNILNAGEASLALDSSCSSTGNSSDSLVRSAQTTQGLHSNCTLEGSSYSSPQLTSSDSLSAAATREMSSDSGVNPTNSSNGEILRIDCHAENVSESGDADIVEASTAKNEDREKMFVDLCDGEVKVNQTDTRTCVFGAEINSADGSGFDNDGGPGIGESSLLQQSSFGHDQAAVERHSAGVSSTSSTDWESQGARPKRFQGQYLLPQPAPKEIISPTESDGLTVDFLARHSQDKALLESLCRDDVDISLFNDIPLQGASESNKGGEVERKEQLIREPRERERREREERELQEAERWLQQQEAMLCEHYEGDCRVRHSSSTAQDGSGLPVGFLVTHSQDQTAVPGRIAAGVSCGSDTNWDRLGARPRQVQGQCPHPELIPPEVIIPVSDGLRRDFLARHSQDRTLQWLCRYSADTAYGDDVYGIYSCASFSASSSSTSGAVMISSSTGLPALDCAYSNSLTLGPGCDDSGDNHSTGLMLNGESVTHSLAMDDSLVALEQRIAEACAYLEEAHGEREERELCVRRMEIREQMVREQREEERREREEREVQQAEMWPQQQEAIFAPSPWLCNHYMRYCTMRFPCCTQFYSCHRCHNNSRACDNDEAKACHATHLKCSRCHHEQEFPAGGKCINCNFKVLPKFCSTCNHLDENPCCFQTCIICGAACGLSCGRIPEL